MCISHVLALPSGRASVKRGGTTGFFNTSSPFLLGTGFFVVRRIRRTTNDERPTERPTEKYMACW